MGSIRTRKKTAAVPIMGNRVRKTPESALATKYLTRNSLVFQVFQIKISSCFLIIEKHFHDAKESKKIYEFPEPVTIYFIFFISGQIAFLTLISTKHSRTSQ